ncbi:Gfo/Idh/MocA family protein [Actinoplanes auranticolor]|uniref:Gfo/Idh/MocA-like oxidoreductase N-terminal domain-containing protein n=1 Tax=Actinoplanes auranticolor TaxID=47988 RepID=A0A919SQA4_9ACTN|nr:Gfo/Idh/MocA family oxidoreductase [Actinoplanes auranticolor]GIM77040.1 hypothetical protein Aau02nite_73870 [Actinoplanes auranticolor]
MTHSSPGVAVIGAGVVGRAHTNAYRNAGTVFAPGRPAPRLVAIADAHEPFAADAAARYGFARTETDWRAVIEAPDIDAVTVAVANNLHREIVEAALAAGKHVLCEKPLAPASRTRRPWSTPPRPPTGWRRSASSSAAPPRSPPSSSRSARAAWAGCGTSSAPTSPTSASIRSAR